MVDENGELVDNEFRTDKIEGKKPVLNFNFTKNFTIECVTKDLVLYWLKNNVG